MYDILQHEFICQTGKSVELIDHLNCHPLTLDLVFSFYLRRDERRETRKNLLEYVDIDMKREKNKDGYQSNRMDTYIQIVVKQLVCVYVHVSLGIETIYSSDLKSLKSHLDV